MATAIQPIKPVLATVKPPVTPGTQPAAPGGPVTPGTQPAKPAAPGQPPAQGAQQPELVKPKPGEKLFAVSTDKDPTGQVKVYARDPAHAQQIFKQAGGQGQVSQAAALAEDDINSIVGVLSENGIEEGADYYVDKTIRTNDQQLAEDIADIINQGEWDGRRASAMTLNDEYYIDLDHEVIVQEIRDDAEVNKIKETLDMCSNILMSGKATNRQQQQVKGIMHRVKVQMETMLQARSLSETQKETNVKNEALKFGKGFPDVDHMPGQVIRNASLTTDTVEHSNQQDWQRAADLINSRVYDDDADYTSNSKGRQVQARGVTFAMWDNDKNKGWVNIKGNKITPMSSKNMTENNKYSATDDVVKFALDTERAYEAVMARFGDIIDYDEAEGTMTVPERIWPKVEMVAFDADGIGAIRTDDDRYATDEGVAGGVIGGAAGALVTKTPGGAMAGYKIGSGIQDAFSKDKDDVEESKHGLNKRVRIVGGPANVRGKIGTVGEVRHGLFKGAPKTYTVDYEDDTGSTQSIQLKATDLRLVKESVTESKMKIKQVAEATKEIAGGRRHTADAGGYGRKADDEELTAADRKRIATAKKAEKATQAPRGRGRPKKDTTSATSSSDAGKALQSWIVGSVPAKSKSLEKLPKTKHKMKDDKDDMDEGKKPDFLDLDKDGDKKEPMKKASADKKKVKEGMLRVQRLKKQISETMKRVQSLPLSEQSNPRVTALITKLEENVSIAVHRILNESHETLDHICRRFPAEVKSFARGGDLDDDLYDSLYDYYVQQGEMPYGIMKARSGDPIEWVTERFEQDVGDHYEEKEMTEARDIDYGAQEGGPDWERKNYDSSDDDHEYEMGKQQELDDELDEGLPATTTSWDLDLKQSAAHFYEKTGDVSRLSKWLEQKAGLPKNSPLYFDDVDLVYGNKTIVRGALSNYKWTFNDLLSAVKRASGSNLELDEVSGANMFMTGEVVFHDNRKGTVDRQEGDKVFVHTGSGGMDVWPASEVSLTRQGMIPTMRKSMDQIGRGMKGFLTGGPELEEGATKQEMHNSAETMTLEQFCSVYGDDESVIEFWHNVNDTQGMAEGRAPKSQEVAKDTVSESATSDIARLVNLSGMKK